MNTDVIDVLVHTRTGDILAHGVGTAAVILLIGLLIVREVAAAYGDPPAADWVRRLNRVVIPLLVVVALVIAVRFARLLA